MANLTGILTGIGETGSQIATGLMVGRERKRREQYQAEAAQRARVSQPLGQPVMGADGKYRQIFFDPQSGQLSATEVPGMPTTDVGAMKTALDAALAKAPDNLKPVLEMVKARAQATGDYDEALKDAEQVFGKVAVEDVRATIRETFAEQRAIDALERQQRDIQAKKDTQTQKDTAALERLRESTKASMERAKLMQSRIDARFAKRASSLPWEVKFQVTALKQRYMMMQQKVASIDATYANPMTTGLLTPEAKTKMEQQKQVLYDQMSELQDEMNSMLGAATQQPPGAPPKLPPASQVPAGPVDLFGASKPQVRMVSPAGVHGSMPANKVDAALKAGWKPE
jgi:hypothetical protein